MSHSTSESGPGFSRTDSGIAHHLADVVQRRGVAERIGVFAGHPNSAAVAHASSPTARTRARPASGRAPRGRDQDARRLMGRRKAAAVLVAIHPRVGEQQRVRGVVGVLWKDDRAIGRGDREPVPRVAKRADGQRAELVDLKRVRSKHARTRPRPCDRPLRAHERRRRARRPVAPARRRRRRARSCRCRT